MHIYKSSNPEVAAGESGVQGQPELRSEFEASLGYMRLCPQTNINAARRMKVALGVCLNSLNMVEKRICELKNTAIKGSKWTNNVQCEITTLDNLRTVGQFQRLQL